MSEFFLELFSEEIPSRLQIKARNDLTQILKKFFDDNEIIVKGKINTYSTPNRLIVHINKIPRDLIKKAEEIRGPNINAPEKALEGFLKSNKISKEKIFKKSTEKGIFYFYNKPSQKIKTYDLLKENIASLLLKICVISFLALICNLEGISSLNNSRKNSDILILCFYPNFSNFSC